MLSALYCNIAALVVGLMIGLAGRYMLIKSLIRYNQPAIVALRGSATDSNNPLLQSCFHYAFIAQALLTQPTLSLV